MELLHSQAIELYIQKIIKKLNKQINDSVEVGLTNPRTLLIRSEAR